MLSEGYRSCVGRSELVEHVTTSMQLDKQATSVAPDHHEPMLYALTERADHAGLLRRDLDGNTTVVPRHSVALVPAQLCIHWDVFTLDLASAAMPRTVCIQERIS